MPSTKKKSKKGEVSKKGEKMNSQVDAKKVEEDEDPAMYLTPIELKDIEVARVRIDMNKMQVENFDLKIEALKIRHAQEMAILKHARNEADKSRMSATQDYEQVRFAIEDRLGVSFLEYNYDDRTGMLRYLGNAQDVGGDKPKD